jgi:hypothetical protein
LLRVLGPSRAGFCVATSLVLPPLNPVLAHMPGRRGTSCDTSHCLRLGRGHVETAWRRHGGGTHSLSGGWPGLTGTTWPRMTAEAAKAPTRLPPDCDTPPVRRQGRLWPQGNEHRRKCLVNVHAKPLLTPSLQRMDRQQSVRWGRGAARQDHGRAGPGLCITGVPPRRPRTTINSQRPPPAATCDT